MEPEDNTVLFLQRLDDYIEKIPVDQRDKFVGPRDDFKSRKITKAVFREKIAIAVKSTNPGPEKLFKNIQLHLDTYPVKPVQTFTYGSRKLMRDDRYPDEEQLVEIRCTCICEFCATLIPIPVGTPAMASTSMVTIYANRLRYDVCNACLPKLFEHFAPKRDEDGKENNKRKRT